MTDATDDEELLMTRGRIELLERIGTDALVELRYCRDQLAAVKRYCPPGSSVDRAIRAAEAALGLSSITDLTFGECKRRIADLELQLKSVRKSNQILNANLQARTRELERFKAAEEQEDAGPEVKALGTAQCVCDKCGVVKPYDPATWSQDQREGWCANYCTDCSDSGPTSPQTSVEELGRQLFWDPRGPIDLYPHGPYRPGMPRVSWDTSEDGNPPHPARLVSELEATEAGCRWLLDRWMHLRGTANTAGPWFAPDKLKMIRLLGKQPLDAVDDPQVASIFLATSVIHPEGGEPFAALWNEMNAAETTVYRQRLAWRGVEQYRPRDAAQARSMLDGFITVAVQRLEAKLANHVAAKNKQSSLPGDARISELLAWPGEGHQMPQRALPRAEVYRRLDAERDYMDALPSTRTDSRPKTVGDHLTLVRVYATKADVAYVECPTDAGALDVLRKVVGLGLRCLEEHGCPERQIANQITSSDAGEHQE